VTYFDLDHKSEGDFAVSCKRAYEGGDDACRVFRKMFIVF